MSRRVALATAAEIPDGDEDFPALIAALAGLGFAGGLNKSAVHWDMVKELRQGGRIELDGEVVQENGVWVL